MKDKTAIILRISLTVLLVISAALFVIFYVRGEDFTNAVLTWAYILVILTAFLTLAFPIVNFILHPLRGKAVLFGIIGFVILYLISHFIASGSIQGDVYETFAITEGVSRFIGAMLSMTYILGGLAILSIVFSGIFKLFR